MKHVAGFFLPNDDQYFGPILEREGSFEISHLHAALSRVQSFEIAIDGGACFGGWTVEMAKRFRHVYAFEPSKNNCAALLANVSDYPNVTVLPYALGKEHGTCTMQSSVTRAGNIGAHFVTHGADVQVITLDSLMIPSVSFLKLDIEGSEEVALRGAERTLLTCKPVVLIEEKRFRDTEGRIHNNPLAAGLYLESLGMVKVDKIGNDAIFIWP